MLSKSVILFVLAAAVLSPPSSASVIDAVSEFSNSNASLPEKVAKFYFSLSNDEKESLTNAAAQLQSGAANFSLSNSSFMDTLKSSSQDLFLKFTGIRDAINSRLQKLSPEAFQFMEDLIRRFIAIFAAGSNISAIAGGLSGFGKEAVIMYDKLSDKAKGDLSQQFPTVTAFLTSDISRLVLNRVGDLSIGAGKLIELLIPRQDDKQKSKTTDDKGVAIEEVNKADVIQLGYEPTNSKTDMASTTIKPISDQLGSIEDIVNERVEKVDVNRQ